MISETHKAAVEGLKLNTAKLTSFAESNWTWLNPGPNRVRIKELIAEVVSYYKALDRIEIGRCVSVIEAARVAMYAALQASAENAQERGRLIVEEMELRRGSFNEIIKALGCQDVEAFKLPDPVLVPIPAPALEAVQETVQESAPVLVPEQPKGPSFFERLQSLVTGLWTWINSLFAKKPEAPLVLTVSIEAKKEEKQLPLEHESQESIELRLAQYRQEQREHQQRLKQFEQEKKKNNPPLKAREPGELVGKKTARMAGFVVK